MNERAEQLFEENQGLVYWTIKTYYPLAMGDEDILQEGMIGLWEACLNFEEGRSQFSTWAVRCITNSISKEFRRRNKKAIKVLEAVSLDEPVSDAEGLFLYDTVPSPENPLQSVEEDFETFLNDLNKFISGLSDRDQRVIENQMKGIDQCTSAKKIGVSQPTISRRLKAIRKMYNRGRKSYE